MPNIEADQFIHVVAGLIRDSQNPRKIFITKRKKGQHLENLWEFPGGKVETGESRFHALKRELGEEIGIQVNSATPFQSVFHRYKDKNIFLDVWEVKDYSGEAQGIEGQEVCWLNLNDISSYKFPDADLPVLKALNLPDELLITPDLPVGHESSFIEQFERLIKRHNYPLVQFRSHHLDDKTYAQIAEQLHLICQQHQAQIIISRPSLKGLQSKLFKSYHRRHLTSFLLQSLTSRPFDQNMILSASCHDEAELKMAERLDCEFAVLSTVRETGSHPGRKAKGWFQIKQLILESQLPVFALGGVKRKDLCIARFQGAIGVAGIADFWSV